MLLHGIFFIFGFRPFGDFWRLLWCFFLQIQVVKICSSLIARLLGHALFGLAPRLKGQKRKAKPVDYLTTGSYWLRPLVQTIIGQQRLVRSAGATIHRFCSLITHRSNPSPGRSMCFDHGLRLRFYKLDH